MWAFSSYRNQIKKEWSTSDFMSNTNIQKIRFLQHNCAKSTNTMISCLKYDLKKKINIICIQESWIEANQIIISHSTYNRILSDQKESHKQRVMTFVFKSFKFSITSRSNLCTNTNIQILNISETNIENFTIVNVYNEKSQKSNSDEYTIERKLKTIELTKNSFVCDDFNAHHQWWNSRIASLIRANALIDWLNKFNCELINISDDYTFNRENSCSVIDLTFVTVDLASKITNWSINNDAETNSNHEVIEFSINVEDIETVNNSMTKKFNTQKANWNKFSQYFKDNYSSIKNKMSRLLINSTLDSLNEEAKLLRNVIIETSNQSISKRRSCENSKVWWTNELTQLRKNLARAKRMHKVSKTEENLSIFKRNRNDYFQAIRAAKKESWSNFLNNAVEKKIFQAYKFTKNYRRFTMKKKQISNLKINAMHSLKQCILCHQILKTLRKTKFD
jgi:hypothetical protein